MLAWMITTVRNFHDHVRSDLQPHPFPFLSFSPSLFIFIYRTASYRLNDAAEEVSRSLVSQMSSIRVLPLACSVSPQSASRDPHGLLRRGQSPARTDRSNAASSTQCRHRTLCLGLRGRCISCICISCTSARSPSKHWDAKTPVSVDRTGWAVDTAFSSPPCVRLGYSIMTESSPFVYTVSDKM